jgi:hypothetical protein
MFGAYFPAWRLVVAVGIFAAVVAHITTVATGPVERFRYRLLNCTPLGVTTAVVWWLMWFAIGCAPQWLNDRATVPALPAESMALAGFKIG